MGKSIIGVDIGATKMHIGLVKGSKVIKDLVLPTSRNAEKQQIVLELIHGIEKVASSEVSGIGIGVPGLIDEEKGIIYDLSNIPSWKEVFLKQELEEHFKIPVKITNDANTFALGVKKFGKGSPYKNMVGITLGSGFGTGIIINDELYSGTLSGAGELSKIPYLDTTIEDYCSGKFFRTRFGLEGSKVQEMAQRGDQEALKAFSEFGIHVGRAIKTIVHILAPQAVFLGGSITKSFSFFEESLRSEVDSFPLKRIGKQLVLERSNINVSILGSAALIDTRN